MQETQETRIWSLIREDTLEEGVAACFGILAWKIPWTEEAGGLQSMGSQRVRQDWAPEHADTHTSSKGKRYGMNFTVCMVVPLNGKQHGNLVDFQSITLKEPTDPNSPQLQLCSPSPTQVILKRLSKWQRSGCCLSPLIALVQVTAYESVTEKGDIALNDVQLNVKHETRLLNNMSLFYKWDTLTSSRISGLIEKEMKPQKAAAQHSGAVFGQRGREGSLTARDRPQTLAQSFWGNKTPLLPKDPWRTSQGRRANHWGCLHV